VFDGVGGGNFGGGRRQKVFHASVGIFRRKLLTTFKGVWRGDIGTESKAQRMVPRYPCTTVCGKQTGGGKSLKRRFFTAMKTKWGFTN